jgi:DNA helicase-2/ATP-dependent DNA helicase PcrA
MNTPPTIMPASPVPPSTMPATTPPYLAGLNPPQALAVTTLAGPVLVLAGAGTGKTRVLVTRLAHLLQTGAAYPSQILAVTFTNKAANEMKDRVSRLLGGQPVEGWWLGTFHALAARMLRAHADKVGLTAGFTILDDDDQVRLIKQILEAENIDPKKSPPQMVHSIISRFKDKGLTPDQLGAGDAGDIVGGKIPALYRQYQARLKTLNACDFGDLLLHMITIFRSPQYPEVLADYHRKFRYIMVDEYQDTNIAQYLWLRLLARGHNNICCVGDDDQSIYGWRGAEISNILKFDHDFKGATVIRLEQNYRSTGHILAAASTLIAHNRGRLGKTLWSSEEMGQKPHVEAVWDGDAEARWISDQIETHKARGEKLSTMAILVRAGFQMRAFEERFLQIGLPYRVFGGPRFYERAEIRDALAYFRVVTQANDDLALERIINVPKRALGEATIQSLYTLARAQQSSLYQALEAASTHPSFKPKARQTMAALATHFRRWRDQIATLSPQELAEIILDESGYTAMLQADRSPEAPGRLENLKELVNGIADYSSLAEFLEHIALVMDNTKNTHDDALSIMTLHAAKGLEFPTVFLPGWEEGIFPSGRALDESGVAGLEEERRLAYVGLTRSRSRVYITCAGSRRQYGNWVQNLPSRFIGELPADHITTNAAQGTAMRQPALEAPTNFPSRYQDPRPSSLRKGQRIHHPHFGAGTILSDDDNAYDIRFDDGKKRSIIKDYVEPLLDPS